MPLLQPHNPTREVCRASIGELVVVRAGEERWFFANVDCLFHDFPTAGVLEPKEGFEERHQLLLARVMAIPDKGLIPLRAANLSSDAIMLHIEVQPLANSTLYQSGMKSRLKEPNTMKFYYNQTSAQ